MVRLITVSGRHNGFALSTRAAVLRSESLYVAANYQRAKNDKRRSSAKRTAGKIFPLRGK